MAVSTAFPSADPLFHSPAPKRRGRPPQDIGIAQLVLGAGGALYTLGAVVYATGRPDPFPRVFGYHEVFHALTLIGFALHVVAVLSLTS